MLAQFSGKLYFTAETAATGREPYVVNNGGNVSLIANLNPGSASSNPSAFYEFAGNLYFSAEVQGVRYLYREAPSGTSDPVRVNLGEDVSDPRDFVTFNGKLYFSADRRRSRPRVVRDVDRAATVEKPVTRSLRLSTLPRPATSSSLARTCISRPTTRAAASSTG